jgi:hypothetical protein
MFAKLIEYTIYAIAILLLMFIGIPIVCIALAAVFVVGLACLPFAVVAWLITRPG